MNLGELSQSIAEVKTISHSGENFHYYRQSHFVGSTVYQKLLLMLENLVNRLIIGDIVGNFL